MTNKNKFQKFALVLYIIFVIILFVLFSSVHMAEPSGRFCGRKWPRSGASGQVL